MAFLLFSVVHQIGYRCAFRYYVPGYQAALIMNQRRQTISGARDSGDRLQYIH